MDSPVETAPDAVDGGGAAIADSLQPPEADAAFVASDTSARVWLTADVLRQAVVTVFMAGVVLWLLRRAITFFYPELKHLRTTLRPPQSAPVADLAVQRATFLRKQSQSVAAPESLQPVEPTTAISDAPSRASETTLSPAARVAALKVRRRVAQLRLPPPPPVAAVGGGSSTLPAASCPACAFVKAPTAPGTQHAVYAVTVIEATAPGSGVGAAAATRAPAVGIVADGAAPAEPAGSAAGGGGSRASRTFCSGCCVRDVLDFVQISFPLGFAGRNLYVRGDGGGGGGVGGDAAAGSLTSVCAWSDYDLRDVRRGSGDGVGAGAASAAAAAEVGAPPPATLESLPPALAGRPTGVTGLSLLRLLGPHSRAVTLLVAPSRPG